jgi:hypothetical protein
LRHSARGACHRFEAGVLQFAPKKIIRSDQAEVAFKPQRLKDASIDAESDCRVSVLHAIQGFSADPGALSYGFR